MDNGRKSRRLLKIVADLLPDPEAASAVSDNGGISGTIRLSAGDIEDLYKADLYINVATDSDERLLRGRIMPQVRMGFSIFQTFFDSSNSHAGVVSLAAHDRSARIGEARPHEG